MFFFFGAGADGRRRELAVLQESVELLARERDRVERVRVHDVDDDVAAARVATPLASVPGARARRLSTEAPRRRRATTERPRRGSGGAATCYDGISASRRRRDS